MKYRLYRKKTVLLKGGHIVQKMYLVDFYVCILFVDLFDLFCMFDFLFPLSDCLNVGVLEKFWPGAGWVQLHLS